MRAAIVGVVALIAWRESALAQVVHEVFAGLVASTLVYVVVSLRSTPYRTDVLDELFDRHASARA